ncbi:MAG: thioredoxin family protein [Pseudolabrys sp.]|nr:thioredoxin family protein [Pseudolabrys sp.]
MFIALMLAMMPSGLCAAELVMFEKAGCPWCQAFDREIAPIYGKTNEGLRAPLRRVRIDDPLPADLTFVQVERLTPLFVLVDAGHEVGRIRGYPGEDHFWGLLGVLIEKLDEPGTSQERARLFKNTPHVVD